MILAGMPFRRRTNSRASATLSLKSAVDLLDEAQTAGAILGHNFQSSPFYDDAFRQLRGRGLSAEVRGDSWLTNVYRQTIQGRWL